MSYTTLEITRVRNRFKVTGLVQMLSMGNTQIKSKMNKLE